MELIIKIDKELYEAYKGKPPMLGDAGMDMIAQAIANGIPLPKGHGRLKDTDALKTSRTWALVEEKNAHKNEIAFAPLVCVLKEDIDNAMTIVEADKESEADND